MKMILWEAPFTRNRGRCQLKRDVTGSGFNHRPLLHEMQKRAGADEASERPFTTRWSWDRTVGCGVAPIEKSFHLLFTYLKTDFFIYFNFVCWNPQSFKQHLSPMSLWSQESIIKGFAFASTHPLFETVSMWQQKAKRERIYLSIYLYIFNSMHFSHICKVCKIILILYLR